LDGADIILDWKQMASWSRTLGSNTTVLPSRRPARPGASRAEIRAAVFEQLFAWCRSR
jgi:hypothetical protein